MKSRRGAWLGLGTRWLAVAFLCAAAAGAAAVEPLGTGQILLRALQFVLVARRNGQAGAFGRKEARHHETKTA